MNLTNSSTLVCYRKAVILHTKKQMSWGDIMAELDLCKDDVKEFQLMYRERLKYERELEEKKSRYEKLTFLNHKTKTK